MLCRRHPSKSRVHIYNLSFSFLHPFTLFNHPQPTHLFLFYISSNFFYLSFSLMRGTLHISLLAATLSPSLVHSSPIPFVQNYNSSPRPSSQALSESTRPGGVFSGRGPLTHSGSLGLGLGLLNLGSGNGGNGGDASSGSSYAQGGYVPKFLLCSRCTFWS
jgi:hypothetical protein